MARDQQKIRSIAVNRRARHRYEVLDELECGVSLKGTEVKSLRAGHASLTEAYARFRGSELWLVGATIPEYAMGNIHNHAPGRDRKLLAHRREMAKWRKQVTLRGTTMVPLEIFLKGHLVKVQLALVRGKQLHDKRRVQQERDAQRDMERAQRRRR